MKILDLFKLDKKEGDIGIEIEVEGTSLHEVHDYQKYWRTVHEGSINGVEYVLKNPLHIEEGICILSEMLHKINEVKGIFSHRTSIHIHFNVQDLTVNEVMNFITLYLILEDGMMRYCGETRVGNHFCLRSRDAEGFISILEQAVINKKFFSLFDKDIRYASLNILSLAKYGSLEFRGMRGTYDANVIQNWVQALNDMKEASKMYKNPSEILPDISELDIPYWIRKILPSTYRVFDFKEEEVRERMRALQMFAFCGVWDDLYFMEEPMEDI